MTLILIKGDLNTPASEITDVLEEREPMIITENGKMFFIVGDGFTQVKDLPRAIMGLKSDTLRINNLDGTIEVDFTFQYNENVISFLFEGDEKFSIDLNKFKNVAGGFVALNANKKIEYEFLPLPVDNLTTDDSKQYLSAKQGKIIFDRLVANENISIEYNNQTGILSFKENNNLRATVNLGIEKYVSQASIVTNPAGQPTGKYIKLEFEGGANPIFIPTADIGKIYSAGNGIEISTDGVISCELDFSHKQDKLISGNNIKTVNNNSLLGSGNIEIQGGGGLPPLTNLRSGKYLYKANDSNKPIQTENEDQTVLILSNYYGDTTDIAIITTRRIDYSGKLWVTGRWSTNNYLTPIEVTDSTIRNYFNEIIKLNPTNFKYLAEGGQSLTVERSENIMSGYDWVSNNRPFTMYRQGCFLIFKETIVNTTYHTREAFIIGYGSQSSSSWGGTQKIGIKYKPPGSTTWGAETLF